MDTSATSAVEPTVELLRVVDGARLADVSPYAAALTSPPRAARGRENEQLFILLWLIGQPTRQRYQELREMVARTYWATSGSITAALRRAVAAVNRDLFRRNLRLEPVDRCYGGLSCAVLHGEDLFMLQAGPGGAFVHQRDHHELFPRRERLAHLGISPLADVRLHHAFVTGGETLLLTSPSLLRQAGVEAVTQVLPRPDVSAMPDALERMAEGADLTVLIARLTPQPAQREGAPKAPSATDTEPHPTPAPPAREAPSRKAPQPGRGQRVRGTLRATGGRIQRLARAVSRGLRSLGRTGRTAGSGLIRGGRRILQILGQGIGFVAQGVLAAGSWLLGSLGVLFRRMLPGVEAAPAPRRSSRSRRPRAAPGENRVVMMVLAIVIPVIVAAVVALNYVRLQRSARFRDLINQAESRLAAAQAAGTDAEAARPHWEAAINLAEQAADAQPGAPTPEAIRAEARAALDAIDRIVRLTPTQLFDFGSSAPSWRLVARENSIFVFDPEEDVLAHLPLNATGDGLAEEGASYLIQTEQSTASEVGDLIDCVWVEQAEGRRSGALVVLSTNGGILSFDPSWDTAGSPDRNQSALGAPPRKPRALSSYQGRIYILDVPEDEAGQIWRYYPNGDTYTDEPEPYFDELPSKPLAEVVDLAIDGRIYLLYADGMINKFLGGEPETFTVRGVPDGLGEALAFAVDPETDNGPVYVADRAADRVVVLGPDGAFQRQFRAEGAFDDLTALAADEGAGRLYVLSGGKVYAMRMP